MPTLRRILFVDDEPDIRAIGELALEAFGSFEVLSCSSGDEALESAPNFNPDIILLDVMMPGMDGPTTLQKLQADARTAGIPVVFFTAKTQRDDLEELRLPGAVGMLTKPFDPTTLANDIDAIWRRHNDRQPAA